MCTVQDQPICSFSRLFRRTTIFASNIRQSTFSRVEWVAWFFVLIFCATTDWQHTICRDGRRLARTLVIKTMVFHAWHIAGRKSFLMSHDNATFCDLTFFSRKFFFLQKGGLKDIWEFPFICIVNATSSKDSALLRGMQGYK